MAKQASRECPARRSRLAQSSEAIGTDNGCCSPRKGSVAAPAIGDLRDPRRARARTRFQLVRGAHDAGESRVAIRGAGRAARGDQHALAVAREAV